MFTKTTALLLLSSVLCTQSFPAEDVASVTQHSTSEQTKVQEQQHHASTVLHSNSQVNQTVSSSSQDSQQYFSSSDQINNAVQDTTDKEILSIAVAIAHLLRNLKHNSQNHLQTEVNQLQSNSNTNQVDHYGTSVNASSNIEENRVERHQSDQAVYENWEHSQNSASSHKKVQSSQQSNYNQQTTASKGISSASKYLEQGKNRPDRISTPNELDAKYNYGLYINDQLRSNYQEKTETRENGKTVGYYKYDDGNIFREVHYEADKNGFRIISDTAHPSAKQPDIHGDATVGIFQDGNILKYTLTSDQNKDVPKRV